MSSIKLSPNASGTGIFSIEAPNSNTNRTLTLPDQTGTVLTNAGPFTANASASAGAVTIDASNNVGIGTSSPSYKLDVNGQIRGDFVIRATQGAVTSYLVGNSGGFGAVGTASNHPILFNTNDTERARIDTSGNLLVGTTTAVDVASGTADGLTFYNSNTNLQLSRSAGTPLLLRRRTSDGEMVAFRRDTTFVGSISVTTTATAYNTSSDYRLKHDIAPMTGALAKVAALKPVTYKWNVDDSDGEGFIAHELQAVVPGCVTGEKDAVDAEGNPVYQGIDTSFLVATLTAAIQELHAKVAALEARLASDGPSNGAQA